jgi:hypothetical protein
LGYLASWVLILMSATQVFRRACVLCLPWAAIGLLSCTLDASPSSARMTCSSGSTGEASGNGNCSAAEKSGRKAMDTADQEPAPLASVLAKTGGAIVDDLERDAKAPPPEFLAIVREFMALESFPRAFAEQDVRKVHILPESHPGAEQFSTGDHAAITLDSLVIFEDERYDAIESWNAAWEDVLAGTLSQAQDRALFTMLHELVHVRQFREMGRERFLSEYLADALRSGEQSVELEHEAYAIAPGEDSWARKAIAEAR